MGMDPAAWLAEQPAFAEIAVRLGKDPVEYGREVLAATRQEPVGVTPEPRRNVGNALPPEYVDNTATVRRLQQRIDEIESKTKKQDRRLVLLRDDVERLEER